MIHSIALIGNRAGLAASTCTGELETLSRHADEVWEQGHVVQRVVEVLQCHSCRRFVSMCEGKALNDYAQPNKMVEELSRAFTVKP